MTLHDLPAVNASLNAASGVLLLVGYALVRAREANVPTATFSLDCHADRAERDLVMATWLEEHGVELVVLAGYMHLLTKPFLDRFPDRIVNVHPALLPAFPGVHAHKQTFDYGVKIAGCTVHFVDAGVDTGPVIAQAAVAVQDDDDEEALRARILAEEHRLLPAVVRAIAERRVVVDGRRVRVLGAKASNEVIRTL